MPSTATTRARRSTASSTEGSARPLQLEGGRLRCGTEPPRRIFQRSLPAEPCERTVTNAHLQTSIRPRFYGFAKSGFSVFRRISAREQDFGEFSDPHCRFVGDSHGWSSAVRPRASFLNQPLKERLQWLPRRRARRRLRRRLLRRAARRPETSTSTSAKDFVVRLGVRSEPCFFSGPPAEALARVQPRADRLPAP